MARISGRKTVTSMRDFGSKGKEKGMVDFILKMVEYSTDFTRMTKNTVWLLL
jgi:hypothetical protein